MKLSNLLFLLAITLLTSFGCKDDDDMMPVVEESKFENGFFVTNEGPFGQGTGTISFYDTAKDSVLQNVYQAENDNAVLGNIVQSMASTSDSKYIVVNNANKIVVLDKTTFQRTAVIEGFELPRYFIANEDESIGYVSQWGADGLSGSVAVVDLATNTIMETIPTGSGPEKMLLSNSKLYVVNAGGFGADKNVTVINIEDKTIETQIEVADNPNSIGFGDTGDIWVLCGGFTDFTDPANTTMGALLQIENDEVVFETEVSNGAKNLFTLRGASTNLMYTTPLGIVQRSKSTPLIPGMIIESGSCYSFAVDTNMGIHLYCSDAKDFASIGTVTAYTENGDFDYSFDAGIIPGGFTFD